jgi:hypothetical protein
MLLLMAIHFHSSQLTWICDHMCNTLGMRINIRQSTMGKMKQIFTQDVFPEQVYIFFLLSNFLYLLIFNIRLWPQEV